MTKVLSSAMYMPTTSPKISDLTKNDFFQLSVAPNDEKVRLQISAVFGTREHVDCGRVFRNRTFYAVNVDELLECV